MDQQEYSCGEHCGKAGVKRIDHAVVEDSLAVPSIRKRQIILTETSSFSDFTNYAIDGRVFEAQNDTRILSGLDGGP